MRLFECLYSLYLFFSLMVAGAFFLPPSPPFFIFYLIFLFIYLKLWSFVYSRWVMNISCSPPLVWLGFIMVFLFFLSLHVLDWWENE